MALKDVQNFPGRRTGKGVTERLQAVLRGVRERRVWLLWGGWNSEETKEQEAKGLMPG